MMEKTLDSKEIEPVNPKGNQPWILIGRTYAEPEAPKLWSPDAKTWLTRKDPEAGKDLGQEEKGEAEDTKKRWQEYTELYKKDLNDTDNHKSILKEISPEYSLEGLMLKLQYFGHLMQRTDSFEKILMLGKIEGERRRGQQRMR